MQSLTKKEPECGSVALWQCIVWCLSDAGPILCKLGCKQPHSLT